MSLSNLHRLFTLLLLFSCHNVAANTEIINFSPSRVLLVDLPSNVFGNWSDSRLHPSGNERRWSLPPAPLYTPLHQMCERTDDDLNAVASSPLPFRANCPHELWVFLDLDDGRWASYTAFTLRLSWPASTPVDVALSLYAPQDLLDVFQPAPRSTPPAPLEGHPTTRARYARIRAVRTGVPAPAPATRPAQLDSPTTPVPFVLVLEPLYMGILPASLLPTVGALVLVVLVAARAVPWVTTYLAPFARQASADALGVSGPCVGGAPARTHTRGFKDR